MRVGFVALIGLVLGACGAVEGPLLRRIDSDAVAPDGEAGLDASGPSSAIAQNVTWQYQLTGTIDYEADVDLFVIDLFEPDSAQLADLHARGKIAIAYLSAGTRESYRDDADQFPESAVGNELASYPDEAWLDIRDTTVRALMAARLTLARDKGFDGVLPTNLAAYRIDTGFDLTADDQRDYNLWLATQAHARALLIGLAGDFLQAEQTVDQFDWAVHFGCIARGDCAALDVFKQRGKAVLDVEIEGEAAEVCAQAEQLGINVLMKRPQFDAYRLGCL
jgi:hypothetical protein